MSELSNNVSLEWPAKISYFVQYIMLKSFRYNKHVNYIPKIYLNPDKCIVEYARKMQSEVQNEVQEMLDNVYIPDLLGFYRCKVHFGGDAPSGIYLFIDKIINYSQQTGIGVDSLVIAVFYHEFAHLLAHIISRHRPVKIGDIQNFEEPFCEIFACYAAFVPKLPIPTIRILNKEVPLRVTHSILYYSRFNNIYDILKLKWVSNNDGDLFKSLKRNYPYKWFNHFIEITNKVTNNEKLTFRLIERALNGTLLTRPSDKEESYDKADIFLINPGSLNNYSREEAEHFLPLHLAEAPPTEESLYNEELES